MRAAKIRSSVGKSFRLLGLIAGAASFSPARAAELPENFFPFGAYDKFGEDKAKFGADFSPEQRRDYYTRLFALMREANMNTLVCLPRREVEWQEQVFDLAQAAGVKVIMTVGNSFNPETDLAGPSGKFHRVYLHPAVLAYKYGDEPGTPEAMARVKDHYANIRRFYSKPVLTAFVGEAIDETAQFQTDAWRGIGAEIRWIRFYPFRKTFGLLDWARGKMPASPATMFVRFERMGGGTPWWYIPQYFGTGTALEPKTYWRLPTAAELEASLHLALANGARGVTGFTLQPEKAYVALFTQALEPVAARDGSRPLDAVRKVGALVAGHARLMLAHAPADFAVAANNPAVFVAAREEPSSHQRLVYVINLDTERAQEAKVQMTPGYEVAVAHSVFEGSALPVVRATNGIECSLRLAPGEGVFISLPRP